MKKALITGVTGQDGSYLSEFLLEKGYDVHGIIRRSSVDYRERISHLEGNPHFHLHFGDLHFKTPDHHAARRRVGKHRVDGFCEDSAACTAGTEPGSFLIESAQLRGRILQRRSRRVHKEKRIFIIIWRQ